MDIAILLVPLCNNRTHLQTEVSVNFKQLQSEVQKCLGHITLKKSKRNHTIFKGKIVHFMIDFNKETFKKYIAHAVYANPTLRDIYVI